MYIREKLSSMCALPLSTTSNAPTINEWIEAVISLSCETRGGVHNAGLYHRMSAAGTYTDRSETLNCSIVEMTLSPV